MKIFQTITILFILIHISNSGCCQLWKRNSDSAKFYSDKKDMDKAIEFYSKAKEGLEKDSAESNTYAGICNSLGTLYAKTGEYEQAEPLLLKAKEIREKLSGKDNLAYASTCNNLGSLYRFMGEYKKAESFSLEAKSLKEKLLGKEDPDYAISCNNLGNLYTELGEYEKAEVFYLETKQIREKLFGKEHPDYAQICDNLANLYDYMGQNEKAEALYWEARKIFRKIQGKENADYAINCNNLADFYLNINQYEKAEPLFLEAIQLLKKVLGKDCLAYSESCNNLGELYTKTGQYEKAKSLLLEAKQLREKTLGKESPGYAQSCWYLADFYLNLNQYEKAEIYLLETKKIWEKAFEKWHPNYSDVCISLANLYLIQKKIEKANHFYAEAFHAQNFQLKKIFQFTSEAEKQSYLKTTTDFDNYFFSFKKLFNTQFNQGLSYNVSLSNRNLILSSSQQLRLAVYNATDTSIKNKYNSWINLREQLAFWYSKPLSDRSAYVKDMEEQANTLEKELARLSSEFQKKQVQNNITWQTIQQNLKPTEAAVEFVKFHFYNGKRWTDSIYYIALLLTKNDTTPQLIPLFEEKQLNNLVKAGNTYSTIAALYKNERAIAAYNLIWASIEKHLKGITKIYFAPAGLLYRISLSGLQTNDHEALSDKYQLIQLNTTASVVNKSENFIDTSDKVYLYGGIKYDVDSVTLKQAVASYHIKSANKSFIPAYATRGNDLTYLSYTEKEISEIENLSAQKKISVVTFSGTSASEESIKALNGNASPSVLHIATHGFFFPDPKEKKKSNVQYETGSGAIFQQSDNPLFRSGLLLSGANAAWKGKPVEGVEDGVLTAYEVSNLYLPNTKLVVLSACETGLGDIEGNEGVYGLQRAFKIAGVQNLVMSLWKVGDKETSEFMQELYKNIFDKQSISDAFYDAQTVMKNKYRNEPYKWAAWILVK